VSLIKSRAFSAIFMFALSALFAGILSGVKVLTADKVADNAKIAASKNLVRVFELIDITPETTGAQLAEALEVNVQSFFVTGTPESPVLVDTEPAATEPTLYKMWAQINASGKPLAYAFPIGGKGFWGPIKGIMSVEPDGVAIKTVVWTEHGETPGLGARIEEDGYREKFRGKLASPPNEQRFKVVQEGKAGNDPHTVDQITGATQTTVVGLGTFLNENFADWHKYNGLLKQRFEGNGGE
jgi:Na+-transporting NADH:ubiquinone oxidoreductase subunit C